MIQRTLPGQRAAAAGEQRRVPTHYDLKPPLGAEGQVKRHEKLVGDRQFELLNELTELDDEVRERTKELVWFSGVALLGGAMFVSLPLVIGGMAGGATAWAMRHRKLAWAGAAAVVTVVSLTVHTVLRAAGPWDATRWFDLALCLLLVIDLAVGTWALVRYRKVDTTFQRLARSGRAEA